MRDTVNGIGHYKLTVVAGVVVLVIVAGAVTVFGNTQQSLAFLAFASPTIVALLALLRTEQNAAANAVRHEENRADIAAIRDGQQTLAHDALSALRESHMSTEDASLIAAQIIQQSELHPPTR